MTTGELLICVNCGIVTDGCGSSCAVCAGRVFRRRCRCTQCSALAAEPECAGCLEKQLRMARRNPAAEVPQLCSDGRIGIAAELAAQLAAAGDHSPPVQQLSAALLKSRALIIDWSHGLLEFSALQEAAMNELPHKLLEDLRIPIQTVHGLTLLSLSQLIALLEQTQQPPETSGETVTEPLPCRIRKWINQCPGAQWLKQSCRTCAPRIQTWAGTARQHAASACTHAVALWQRFLASRLVQEQLPVWWQRGCMRAISAYRTLQESRLVSVVFPAAIRRLRQRWRALPHLIRQSGLRHITALRLLDDAIQLAFRAARSPLIQVHIPAALRWLIVSMKTTWCGLRNSDVVRVSLPRFLERTAARLRERFDSHSG